MNADWTGLVGIAFAALLASVGYVYQMWVENKRSARGVLYLLLEIRSSALATVFEPRQAAEAYVQHCITRCQSRGIKLERAQFPADILDLVTTHFDRSTAVARSKIEDRLLRDYEAALLQLASTHPVLAHRLLGRDRLEGLVGLTRSYSQELTQLADVELKEPWAKETIMALASEAQRQAFDEITSTLDNDVLEVARSCSYLEHWRCRKVIRQSAARITHALTHISPLIDQTIEELIQAATRNARMSQDVGRANGSISGSETTTARH